jgi:hypothetical protein
METSQMTEVTHGHQATQLKRYKTVSRLPARTSREQQPLEATACERTSIFFIFIPSTAACPDCADAIMPVAACQRALPL